MGSEDDSILNCPSSGLTMFKSPSGVDSFYGDSNWDPIVSLSQSGNFGNEFANPQYCSVVVENQRVGSSSHLVHFPSDFLPKVPNFVSGGFSSEMVNSFGHNGESGCLPNFVQNNGIGNQMGLTNIANSHENGQSSEDGILGPSPYGKRKRKISVRALSKNEEEQQKDPSGDTSEMRKEDDEKQQKIEQNNGPNSRSKPAVKQAAKDNAIGGEPSKEDYIHVRAKRGQATNSHSLAERVRRERISERMRLLQELVPGCNKITGKAMMLDEIINYVQSLQQQVEFLSMKLATVNPELNVDIDRILSKEILQSRGINQAALGIGSSHPFPGYPQANFNGSQGTIPPFHSLPPHLWNNELQGLLQMGFDHDPSASSLGPNGLSKMEL